MAQLQRREERDATGWRVSYDGLTWGDPDQLVELEADLRALAAQHLDAAEPPRWWLEAPDPAADRVARAAGWRRVRTLVQLRRPLPMDPPPEVEGLRTFDPDRDVDAWLELNNAAFAWHPEQGHQHRAGFAVALTAAWVDLAGFFVVDGPDGAMDGFCWTRFHPAEPSAPGGNGPGEPSMGEVYVVATSDRVRGQGLGRALVLVAMDHQHHQRGAEVAMLWTEADNTAAVRLYRHLGYTLHHTNVAYAPREAS
ncbi:MAG: GNAT family N-acetyltransferase [Microthrixaceae bacterium]